MLEVQDMKNDGHHGEPLTHDDDDDNDAAHDKPMNPNETTSNGIPGYVLSFS